MQISQRRDKRSAQLVQHKQSVQYKVKDRVEQVIMETIGLCAAVVRLRHARQRKGGRRRRRRFSDKRISTFSAWFSNAEMQSW